MQEKRKRKGKRQVDRPKDRQINRRTDIWTETQAN